MFLYVNLMINELAAVPKEKEIHDRLEDAPRDLAKMTHHVFERLAADKDVNKEDLNEILIWVAYAERPLCLRQTDLTLRLRFDGEVNLLPEDNLRGKFASLFTLRRVDGLSTEDLQRRLHCEQLAILDRSNQDGGESGNALSDDECPRQDSFQSDTESITIEFSHASIRDFLRQEGLLADIGIGVKKADAQEHITVTCMSVICDPDHATNYSTGNLLMYAAGHFWKHLAIVNWPKVSLGMKTSLIKHLLSIFCNETIMARWWSAMSDSDIKNLIQMCIATSQCSVPIQTSLKDVSCYEHLSAEDCTWAQTAAASTKELFQPLARYLASNWLQKYEEEPDRYVQFLHDYTQLDKDIPANSEIVANKDESLLPISSLSLANVKNAAQTVGFEKTYLWHARLARALQKAGHIDGAIEESVLSIEMKNSNPAAWNGLASTYHYEDKYDPYAGNLCMLKAMESLPGNSFKGQLWKRIAISTLRLEDFQGAVRAMLIEPTNSSFISAHWVCLYAASQFDRIIDQAKKMNVQKSTSGKQSLLADNILRTGPCEWLAVAAECMDETQFVIEVAKEMCETAKRSNNFQDLCYSHLALAYLHCCHGADEDVGISLYEDLLSVAEKNENDDSIGN